MTKDELKKYVLVASTPKQMENPLDCWIANEKCSVMVIEDDELYRKIRIYLWKIGAPVISKQQLNEYLRPFLDVKEKYADKLISHKEFKKFNDEFPPHSFPMVEGGREWKEEKE